MKLGRLNHIGVATPSIEASIVFWRDVMGATHIHAPFDLQDQGVKVCFVDTPAEGPHMCFEVPDIHAAKAEFEAMGKRVFGAPRIGAHGTLIFFVHPKDMGGVLTEIMETPKEAH